jgi:pectate lyase
MSAHRACRALLAAVLALPALAAAKDSHQNPHQDRQLAAGAEIIGALDGWGSVPTTALPQGTTGGSSAAPERWHIVTNRAELVAALAYPDPTPKRVYIKGEINANVDDAGQPLSCESYYRPDPTTGELYSPEAFLAAFDPAGPWGRVNPSGPQERARAASAAAQSARVRIRIPANTTIYGIGDSPTVRGAWFDIRPGSTSGNQPMNVIIRNIHFEDSGVDCFPVWAPNDGSLGNWNAAYDAISVRNSTHVWIDHNRFEDVATADETLPVLFGRIHQVHDGHVDITNESDLVTVSWNEFLHHDKTMLIGSSDGAVADRGKLRVTLHHNLFGDVGQRVPRVRFGQVHVYNNYFLVSSDARYGYSWGVGIESQLYAENNYLEIEAPFGAADVIDRFNGTRMTDTGNCLDTGTRKSRCELADFVGAWNAVNDPDLVNDAGWVPTLYGEQGAADKAKHVRHDVLKGAGPREPRGQCRKFQRD